MLDKGSVVVFVGITVLIAGVVALGASASGKIAWWRALILLAGYGVQVALMWWVNYLHSRLVEEYNRQASPEDKIKEFGVQWPWTALDEEEQLRAAFPDSPLRRQRNRTIMLAIVAFVVNAALLVLWVPHVQR